MSLRALRRTAPGRRGEVDGMRFRIFQKVWHFLVAQRHRRPDRRTGLPITGDFRQSIAKEEKKSPTYFAASETAYHGSDEKLSYPALEPSPQPPPDKSVVGEIVVRGALAKS